MPPARRPFPKGLHSASAPPVRLPGTLGDRRGESRDIAEGTGVEPYTPWPLSRPVDFARRTPVGRRSSEMRRSSHPGPVRVLRRARHAGRASRRCSSTGGLAICRMELASYGRFAGRSAKVTMPIGAADRNRPGRSRFPRKWRGGRPPSSNPRFDNLNDLHALSARRGMRMTDYRIEKDFLGELKVPKDAYWGAQTQRAIEHFPISGTRFGRRFIYALGLIKMACAQTNVELGLLDGKLGKAIVQGCQEVMDGKLDAQFPLDIFQTGSGTSTNMNANEVIANRANEILGHPLGEKGVVHPNDHVNMGQSSNDVIPTAIHVAALMEVDQSLLPALRELEESLAKKAKEFDPIVKSGRTYWMEATPSRCD